MGNWVLTLETSWWPVAMLRMVWTRIYTSVGVAMCCCLQPMQVEYAYLQHQQGEYPRHHYREYNEIVCPDITSSTDLDYADDVVIFADLLDTLKDAMFIFNEQSQKNRGLNVNWSKTKLQSFSPWIPTPPSTLIGTQPVTTTDKFTNLGCTIANKF